MEENKNTGTCKFCGQTSIVETVGESTQEERDLIATERCKCPEADAERRRAERDAKIHEFIDKHFSYDQQEIVEYLMSLVKKHYENGIDEFSFKSGCKQTRIWIDSDSYIHIKTKKTEDDELKI